MNKTEKQSSIRTRPVCWEIESAKASIKFLLSEIEAGKLTGIAHKAHESIAKQALDRLEKALDILTFQADMDENPFS